ncbi:hypothetical protein HOK51_10880 [Candidatus Woesearchaeota archaeon]|jgi:hypothetical protein|nr:hypothetical protein [Candidatus Woesearchaeota archaeon]MBT6520325.1 hypothetical protein [Candidatus Woesearchaeota archaeon]MBT7368278.1 hypothetical protein [Candidatus Woesearchaeota archaeon]
MAKIESIKNNSRSLDELARIAAMEDSDLIYQLLKNDSSSDKVYRGSKETELSGANAETYATSDSKKSRNNCIGADELIQRTQNLSWINMLNLEDETATILCPISYCRKEYSFDEEFLKQTTDWSEYSGGSMCPHCYAILNYVEGKLVSVSENSIGPVRFRYGSF